MAVNKRLAFPPVVPLCAVSFNLVRSQLYSSCSKAEKASECHRVSTSTLEHGYSWVFAVFVVLNSPMWTCLPGWPAQCRQQNKAGWVSAEDDCQRSKHPVKFVYLIISSLTSHVAYWLSEDLVIRCASATFSLFSWDNLHGHLHDVVPFCCPIRSHHA